ncbi:MAG: poly(A)-specific ribonuclease [Cyphobasidiales sp. Tagirdzhanova-0007]|nr:MAG: poly(A)-specific ribonuclease [Cyphobasidiales sp. Tagirdzhanova-0007]
MSWHEHARTFLPAAQCLAFDAHAELLWSGSLTGQVASHLTSADYDLARYTSYKAHEPGPTRELLVDDRGVLSVGGSLKLASRRGLTFWNVHGSLSEIVAGGANSLGGAQPDLLLVNASTGTILRKVLSQAAVAFVRRSNLVCCGHADGQIELRDPRSLRVEQTIAAHGNGLTGLEAGGNYLFSHGYSIRQGVPIIDPLVKVYDVRFLRPLPPIPFPSLPAFVRPHPRHASVVIMVSAQGQVQVSDLSDPSAMDFFSIETDSYLTSMALAPTGEGLASADADGLLHVWSKAGPGEQPRFARHANNIDMPRAPEPFKPINWTEETPLNMIGMPYYDTQLFSVIPWTAYTSSSSPFGLPPRKIDPAILATMKTVDFVSYAVNPKTSKRNQVVTKGSTVKEVKRMMDVPLFRSEKERERAQRRKDRRKSEPLGADTEEESEAARLTMPRYYRKVEIKYSRFGVEDFDFAYYNKTSYSGLETHILNSYTNALLQVLRFMRPIRKLAEGHIWTECSRGDCFLCESGFLFKMLRDAKGVNCQASNFSRTFTANAQAAALGLMDFDSTSQAAYSSLIQIFNRFLLESMNSECDLSLRNQSILLHASGTLVPLSPIAQLMGLHVRTTSTCGSCAYQASREAISNVLDLVYPRKALSNELQSPTDFSSILKSSISRENTTKTTCANCRLSLNYRLSTNARVKRQLTGVQLPPVLSVNTAVHTSDHMEIWLDCLSQGPQARFLQPRFAINLLGTVVKPLAGGEAIDDESLVIYELQAIVAQIQADDDPAHLVSLIKIPVAEGDVPGWHLFNDFLVRPISEDEALSFPGTWKIPAILYYQRIDSGEMINFRALEVPPDNTILTKDVTISKPTPSSHRVLSKEELPRKGTLVSIDAEFVSLQQEEVEYRSDGTRSLIRPSRMTLARVSVLRGEGLDTGVPFIDDYIQVTEPIVNYLTEFSGILPGDLDANKSIHTLVPAKVAYRKLRLLVDRGCIFIGHGLNKDFRIINIFVPPSQILDTVNIYHLPHRHRKISLRFLSWVVLQQDIQSTGTHDSIEDARTALQLYEKHSQLEAEGEWEHLLEDIYIKGGRLSWKVPGSEKAPASPAMGTMQTLPTQVRPIQEGLAAAFDSSR